MLGRSAGRAYILEVVVAVSAEHDRAFSADHRVIHESEAYLALDVSRALPIFASGFSHDFMNVFEHACLFITLCLY